MTIVDFLVDLAVDPQALARFRLDPEAAMAAAGLSEAERTAIREGKVELPLRTFQQHDIEVTVHRHGVVEPLIESTGDPLDRKGLTVVGLGITALQTTAEARVCISQASKVLYLVTDSVSVAFIQKLNPTAETLENFYERGKLRIEIYNAMVEKIVSCLEKSGDLCVVFYGHPGVLCYPAREALRRAREKGFSARMLPGVSAEDNLVANLGIDLVSLQSYEATAFLTYGCHIDVAAGLILWQVDVLGERRWDPPHTAVLGRLQILSDYLAGFYGRDHQVVLYRAAVLPSGRPEIERLALGDLPGAKLLYGATLYVPPKEPPKPDLDMAKRLGLV